MNAKNINSCIDISVLLLIILISPGCQKNEKEVKLTNIEIDSALKAGEIDKAIDKLKILLVYDGNNQEGKIKLNSLENALKSIMSEDFSKAALDLRKIKSIENYSQLNLLKENCGNLGNATGQMKTLCNSKLKSNKSTYEAMKVLEFNQDLFEIIKSNYNSIYRISKLNKPEISTENMNIPFLLGINEMWNLAMSQVDRTYVREKMEEYGVAVRNTEGGWLPSSYTLNSYSNNNGKRFLDERFGSLKYGPQAGMMLVKFFEEK